jgi:hypothetical protein
VNISCNAGDQIRNLRPAKWGSMVCLHSSSPASHMSVEGQTRSFGDVGSMSGLPESGHGWAIYECTPRSRDLIVAPVDFRTSGNQGTVVLSRQRGDRELEGRPHFVSVVRVRLRQ